MKISNSKKQLAKIIHENGGWREGAQFSAQDKDGEVFHYLAKPTIGAGREAWGHKGCIGYGEFPAKTLPNWHQTILSRDEYLHLYPAPDANDGWILWNGGECPVAGLSVVDVKYFDVEGLVTGIALDFVWGPKTNIVYYRKTRSESEQADQESKPVPAPEAEPTIEQLAADYRNAKDFADRKQQEADAAKADVEAKLAELVAAGKALGLVIKPLYIKGFAEEIAAKSIVDHKRSLEADQEINITDCRRLHAGDVIWLDHGVTRPSGEYEIKEIEKHEETCRAAVMWNHVPWWADLDKIEWRFIRRP